jgi:hypothetical protein
MSNRIGDRIRQSAAETESVVDQADWWTSLVITPLCPLAAAYFWFHCPTATTDLKEHERMVELSENYAKKSYIGQSADQVLDDFLTSLPVQPLDDYFNKQIDENTSSRDWTRTGVDKKITRRVSVT